MKRGEGMGCERLDVAVRGWAVKVDDIDHSLERVAEHTTSTYVRVIASRAAVYRAMEAIQRSQSAYQRSRALLLDRREPKTTSA